MIIIVIALFISLITFYTNKSNNIRKENNKMYDHALIQLQRIIYQWGWYDGADASKRYVKEGKTDTLKWKNMWKQDSLNYIKQMENK